MLSSPDVHPSWVGVRRPYAAAGSCSHSVMNGVDADPVRRENTGGTGGRCGGTGDDYGGVEVGQKGRPFTGGRGAGMWGMGVCGAWAPPGVPTADFSRMGQQHFNIL